MGWDRRGGTGGEGTYRRGGKRRVPKVTPLKILEPPLLIYFFVYSEW